MQMQIITRLISLGVETDSSNGVKKIWEAECE